MKNKNLQEIENILLTINNMEITTREGLASNQELYSSIFYCLENYIKRYVLLSKTHKNKKGEVVVGNADKIRFIVGNSSYDKEDIEMAALVKVVGNLDKVFSKPVEAQPWYIYKICINLVNDYLREIDLGMVWLDAEIAGYSDSSCKSCTYGEMIPDNSYNGEAICIERENIQELTKKIQEKETKEADEKRDAVLLAIKVLSSKPAEVFANLTVHLNIKNRDVCSLFIKNGAVAACEKILQDISREFEISNIDEFINTNSITDKLFKVDSDDPKKVGHQLSELRSRAKTKLKPYQK